MKAILGDLSDLVTNSLFSASPKFMVQKRTWIKIPVFELDIVERPV